MSVDRTSLQRHRINRVVNHIRHNLASELSLELMADTAHLSKYHFSRVFADYLGETPNQYVARIRLEKAAKHFIRAENSNITQVALNCGFSGSDTFSRSFRQRFQCAPRAFKKANNISASKVFINSALEKQIHKPGQIILTSDIKVSVGYRPEYHVAYIRHFGPYGDLSHSITHTFTRLQHWAKQRGLLTEYSSFLGQGTDNCAITPARQCMYDVCFVLEDPIAEDEVVSVQTIPAGVFAVIQIECEPVQLNRHWDWLNKQWLAGSKKTISPRASYEFFEHRGHAPVNSSRGIELCLPISDHP